MTQAYEKVMEMKSPKIEQVETPIESEVDELLGDLNPRYFEEAMTLEDALEKVYSSDIYSSSRYNIFRPF